MEFLFTLWENCPCNLRVGKPTPNKDDNVKNLLELLLIWEGMSFRAKGFPRFPMLHFQRNCKCRENGKWLRIPDLGSAWTFYHSSSSFCSSLLFLRSHSTFTLDFVARGNNVPSSDTSAVRPTFITAYTPVMASIRRPSSPKSTVCPATYNGS